MFYVVVYDRSSGEEVHRVGPINYRSKAEKVESGMLINMNHEHYYTYIAEYEHPITLEVDAVSVERHDAGRGK